MNLNYFKNSNLLARNYVFIISLFCFFSSNSQNYSSDSLSILNFKSEISKAEELIAVKEGNSYQEGIDLFNEIQEQYIRDKGIDTIVVFNKMDLAKDEEIEYLKRKLSLFEIQVFIIKEWGYE